jgi:hypothetical protein
VRLVATSNLITGNKNQSGLQEKGVPFREMWATLRLDYTSSWNEVNFLLCKILGFHGGDYEEWCVLGCYAVWLL